MNILDKDLRDQAQGDLAIDAAEGQVVDLVAEGRDVLAFGRIDLDGEQVGAAVVVKVVGEIK